MSRRKKLIALVVIVIAAGWATNHYVFSKPANLSPAAGAPGGKPGAAGAGAGGPPPTKVEATKAVTEQIAEKMNVVGNLTSKESVVISSEIMGRIVSIPFKEGQEVKKGDLLFKLDDSVQKAELLKAQANYQLAQNNVKRYDDLLKTGAISKVQYEQSQADLNLSTANIDLAKANLEKTTIRAPFSGVAGIRQVSIGDVVQNGQKLVNLEQMSPIRVLFTAPEKYLTQIKEGEKITITSESYPNEIFEGEIFAIDPRIDQTTRSISVQATSPNNDRKLFPGQFVSISMPLESTREAVIVPDQALVPEGTTVSVLLVVDDKAKKVPVKTGMRANNKAEIISGVAKDDVVVTAGQLKIQDGAPVRISEPTEVKVRQVTVEDEKKVLGE